MKCSPRSLAALGLQISYSSICSKIRVHILLVGLLAVSFVALASENVPHAHFGHWAEVLAPKQFEVGIVYEESEAYHIWADNTFHTITVYSSGERYGIDAQRGYVALQYGLAERWSADVAIGVTTVGWRYFSNYGTNQRPQSTTGLMDVPLGVRYQIFREDQTAPAWSPNLTFRLGGIVPGAYRHEIPFAPGNGSGAIEPEFILRKHFGWTGLGGFADALFRWNFDTHNDQYIISVGLFQQIKNWELDVGYHRLASVRGSDIVLQPDRFIRYPANVREINDSVEAGFSYTTSKHRFQYGFYSRTVLEGSNTDGKFWVGAYMRVPLKLPAKS